MKALLVNGRFPKTYWGLQYALPMTGTRAALPPLGLITVAALLPPAWQLRLVDLNVRELSDADLRWADVVLVGGMLIQASSMLEVIDRARALGRRTVVGGPAASTVPGRFSSADHVFVGEAEGRIDELVEAVESPAGSPHLLAPGPDDRPGIGASPIPRFDLLELGHYASMSLQFSRGCPFDCEFCDIVALFGRMPRVKSPGQVLAELDALRGTGYRGSVFFVDDNFIGNKRAVKELLPELQRWQRAEGYPFDLYTEASVNLAADEALVRGMVDAGFSSVFLGIETPSRAALEEAGKRQNLRLDLQAAIDSLVRSGLEVMGGFIVGFDNDEPGIFELQRDFIASLPVPMAMVGVLTALPGTSLWRRLADEGRLREEVTGDQFGRPNFEPRMGEEALLAGYRDLLRAIYSPAAYLRRCRAQIRRMGRFAPAKRPLRLNDVKIVSRMMLRLGVLSPRRWTFWRLMGSVLLRARHTFPAAVALAIKGEHMIRYTLEDVLPRIEGALAEVRAGCAPASLAPGGLTPAARPAGPGP